MGEYHLIIIWNTALMYREAVITQIRQNLEVIGEIAYFWNEEKAHKNFAVFYGERLNNIDYKVEHCGKGKFIVFLVYDKAPNYQMRSTTSGKREVNINIFDLKQALRDLTGGGHKVHATDNFEEVRQNLASLFGKNLDQMIEVFKKSCIEGIEYHRDISGVDGWNSWAEMFEVLNLGTEYVVLRNYETLQENGGKVHGDVDILVTSYSIASTLVAGEKKYRGKNRVAFTVSINGCSQDLDIRYIGDNYYCTNFEKDILSNRIYSAELGVYIQDKDLLASSLLYHALVHKQNISKDYMEYFKERYDTTNLKCLYTILDDYMKNRQYRYVMPCDWTVFINPLYFKKIQNLTAKRKWFIKCLVTIRKLKKIL